MSDQTADILHYVQYGRWPTYVTTTNAFESEPFDQYCSECGEPVDEGAMRRVVVREFDENGNTSERRWWVCPECADVSEEEETL